MRNGARGTTGALTRRRLAAALALSVLAIATLAPPASAGGQNDGKISTSAITRLGHGPSHRLVETWRPCKASGDKGLYWTPVLLRDGARVKPHKSHVYLRNVTSVTPVAFPSGFDYVWGNPRATSKQRNWSSQLFWQCGDTRASTHFATPPNCPNADNGEGETALTLIVRFGQCWDGTKLTWPSGSACPSGTKTFPKLEIHIQYTVPDAGSSKMSLSSNGSITGLRRVQQRVGPGDAPDIHRPVHRERDQLPSVVVRDPPARCGLGRHGASEPWRQPVRSCSAAARASAATTIPRNVPSHTDQEDAHRG